MTYEKLENMFQPVTSQPAEPKNNNSTCFAWGALICHCSIKECSYIEFMDFLKSRELCTIAVRDGS